MTPGTEARSFLAAPRACFWGVPVDALRESDLHGHICQAIVQDQRATYLHINVHGLNLAWQQSWVRTCFQKADLVICDGKGVQYAARVLGTPLPARLTYADWAWALARLAAEHGFTLYFLGGRPGVAEKAARVLQARWPDLQVVGCHHGYFDKHTRATENRGILARINAANPDILLTAFGMPLQEYWVTVHRAQLQTRVVLCGGAVFDYVSGNLARGPHWMTQHGWEWLARLVIEPRRLWRRYLLGNPVFVWRVLRQKLGWLPQA